MFKRKRIALLVLTTLTLSLTGCVAYPVHSGYYGYQQPVRVYAPYTPYVRPAPYPYVTTPRYIDRYHRYYR